jgi:transposase
MSNGKGNTKKGISISVGCLWKRPTFAIRYEPLIGRFYQRTKAKTHGVLAIKAVAHEVSGGLLVRYMRDQVPFDVARALT